MRFALEIAEVVRRTWPDDKPVFFRLSAVDGKGGIWGLRDSIELSRQLKLRGIDFIDVSSGGISGETKTPIVPRTPGYHVGFCERIKKHAGVRTVAVGGITEAGQAEQILQNGQADLVALARELLLNADWPAHAAMELQLADPFQYQPEEYAFRLRKRRSQDGMEINQPGSLSDAAFRELYDQVSLIGEYD